MKCEELMQILEEQSPREIACQWDNVGLLVGDKSKDVVYVYIALDATDEVIEEAVSLKVDLLLTHHPLIFSGIKRINTEDFIGRRIIRLIQNDISYYAMHTNFDIRGMADLAGAKIGLMDSQVLDIQSTEAGTEEGIGRIGNLLEPMRLSDCAKFVREAFELEQVKVFGNPNTLITKAAISPGAGKSEIKHAATMGAQVLITGDIDHHDGIDAVAQGVSIIDAGHYGLEHIFIPYMKEYLERRCRELEIHTHKKEVPFWMI